MLCICIGGNTVSAVAVSANFMPGCSAVRVLIFPTRFISSCMKSGLLLYQVLIHHASEVVVLKLPVASEVMPEL